MAAYSVQSFLSTTFGWEVFLLVALVPSLILYGLCRLGLWVIAGFLKVQ